jgi:hypothetical protein
MWTCTICRFETELDDVVVTMASGHCICLRCFVRETGGGNPMPKALRRELTATLAETGPAGFGG